VTGGKPIAILLQSISGVSGINPLVAFYDIHGGKRVVLFFYFVPDTTQDHMIMMIFVKKKEKKPWGYVTGDQRLPSEAHHSDLQSK
jgi:hypothetical protein